MQYYTLHYARSGSANCGCCGTINNIVTFIGTVQVQFSTFRGFYLVSMAEQTNRTWEKSLLSRP